MPLLVWARSASQIALCKTGQQRWQQSMWRQPTTAQKPTTMIKNDKKGGEEGGRAQKIVFQSSYQDDWVQVQRPCNDIWLSRNNYNLKHVIRFKMSWLWGMKCSKIGTKCPWYAMAWYETSAKVEITAPLIFTANLTNSQSQNVSHNSTVI